MAQQRLLSKAPIREAVLDLRMPESGASVEQLRDLLERLGEFRQIHEMRQESLSLEFRGEGGLELGTRDSGAFGVRGMSKDGLWVTQLRTNGLTVSRLPPYTDWKEFSAYARGCVDALLEVTEPPRVERLALRYINHFHLPYPTDLKDYFVALPSIPEALPRFTSNLLLRLTLHDPEQDYTAHVTQGLLDDLDSEKIGFILDIDAFRTAELPPQASEFWETFEGLRVFKNQIFFELITERNAQFHA